MAASQAEKRSIEAKNATRRLKNTGIALGSSSKHRPTTATTTANISRNGLEPDIWPVGGLKSSSRTLALAPATPVSEIPKIVPITGSSVASRPKTQGIKKALEIKNKPRKSLREDTGNNSRAALNVEDDDVLSSDSFALLYKLFVPNKYPIKNNRFSLRHLLNHLPLIIPTSATSQEANNYFNLNFQIHMFLSNIMVNYVNSWYLTKLNTDNIEFLRLIYQLICDLIKDLSRRINIVLKNEQCIRLIDQLCLILDEHLVELICTNCNDKFDLKVLNDHFDHVKLKNTINHGQLKDLEQLFASFLANQHLIFDPELSFENTDEIEDPDDVIFANETLEQIEEEIRAAKGNILDTNQLVYFRIVIRKILVTTFDSGSEGYKVNPLTSKISSDLVILLLSDLVLKKVFEKLSSPQFILGKVISSIVDSIDMALDLRINKLSETKEPQPFRSRAKSALSSIYGGISYLVVNIFGSSGMSRSDSNEGNEPEPSDDVEGGSIFENSIFRLLNTITNFSNRKPLLSTMLSFVKNYILIHPRLDSKINSICLRYVSNKVLNSRVLSDDFLCQIVNNLREDLFNEDNSNDNNEPEPSNDVTVDILADKIVKMISIKLPRTLPSIFNHANLFKYHGETDEELNASIRKLLVIFNYSPGLDNNELKESCELNKLLIINLLDCIVGNLYPEI